MPSRTPSLLCLHTLQQHARTLILALPRATKRSIALVIDVSLCIFTVWLAFCLRLGELSGFTEGVFAASIISVALALPLFTVFGLYHAIFRYAGWSAMLAISQAIGLYGLLYSALLISIDRVDMPGSIGFIQPLLLFFAIGGSRLLAYHWLGGNTLSRSNTSPTNTLIYGAGDSGQQLASILRNNHEMRVAGFIDDDKHLQGRVLSHLKVHPPEKLGHLVASEQIAQVLLAIPSASRRRRQTILEHIRHYPVAVRTLPGIVDLAKGNVAISDLHELEIEDLLNRESVAPSHALLSKNITGKVVLVTGAGGSIGSELCRQILQQQPTHLLLVEISEYALYAIHSELEHQVTATDSQHKSHLIPLLGSVADVTRMHQIIKAWQPDTIYHAAAYKHVPIVEHNLAEGIRNNVFGTLISARVALEAGVADFVLISTDKAVRPTNVMGASKRLAELCLQALFAYHAEQHTRFSMVRFGNVLGSSGSVIPRFRQQIRDGGPITLTHRDINRFFMTIPEAAQLVIQAGALAQGGDVFVLDMGKPVKIADLARRVVELSGLTICDEGNPEGDIEIEVTGLRPGEKLYEELLLGDNPLPTQHHKIMRAQDSFMVWDQLKTDLDCLDSALRSHDVDAMLNILKGLVTGFKPGATVDWVYSEGTAKHSIGEKQIGT
ncbi:MAG: nucleoside-diphosphate sugar epimerase/dehydratase [Pseudomonadota bacterium]